MKSKILRTVAVVMLSTFLTVTAVPCSTEAAASLNLETCKHLNVIETQVGNITYPNATSSSHQAKVVYDKRCYDCQEPLGTVTRYYSESHTFGADRRCTKCGYYDH